MENVTFTRQELRIKSLLGLPSTFIAFAFALGYSHKGWWVYLGVIILGWYLYTLLYWNLYQRYMLHKVIKEKAKFYGLLVGYQLALFALLVAYAYAMQP